METHPPRLIENLVERLVPPACRENVMGDWAERYRSGSQYLLCVLSTLPRIITSQVRRTFHLGLFLSEASALYIAFGGASLIAGPAYFYDSRAWIPLAIVIGIALVVLVLRDAYANTEETTGLRSGRDAAFAVGGATCSQVLLFALGGSRWTLPFWLLAIAGGASLIMLFLLRRFFHSSRDGSAAPAGGPRSLADLRRRSKDEHRKAWRLNLIWLIGSLVIIFTNPSIRGTRDGGSVVEALLLIAVFLFSFWRTKNGFNPTQEFTALSIVAEPYRNQLERKRDGLAFWASGRGAATLIVVLIAFRFTILFLGWISGKPLPANLNWAHVWISLIAFVVLCVCWAAVRMANLRAARAIQDELDALGAGEKS